MCSKFLILFLVIQCKSLSQDRSDYEIIESSGESKSLTKELLDLDLGYTVLTDAVLRKNLGASTETLLEKEDNVEALPDAQPLVQDRDFKINQFPLTNWDDDKVWGGPSPFFFPDFSGFLRPRPVPASAVRKPAPLHHQTSFRRPQSVPRNSHSAHSSKTFVGDQHQCGVGSCEFFLFCWLGGGIIEGNCGGFLFSCCLRPDGGGENSKILASKVSFFWTNDSPPFPYHRLLCSCPIKNKPFYSKDYWAKLKVQSQQKYRKTNFCSFCSLVLFFKQFLCIFIT